MDHAAEDEEEVRAKYAGVDLFFRGTDAQGMLIRKTTLIAIYRATLIMARLTFFSHFLIQEREKRKRD
jgi:hypothetical protein